jgi:hypothetical protein
VCVLAGKWSQELEDHKKNALQNQPRSRGCSKNGSRKGMPGQADTVQNVQMESSKERNNKKDFLTFVLKNASRHSTRD